MQRWSWYPLAPSNLSARRAMPPRPGFVRARTHASRGLPAPRGNHGHAQLPRARPFSVLLTRRAPWPRAIEQPKHAGVGWRNLEETSETSAIHWAVPELGEGHSDQGGSEVDQAGHLAKRGMSFPCFRQGTADFTWDLEESASRRTEAERCGLQARSLPLRQAERFRVADHAKQARNNRRSPRRTCPTRERELGALANRRLHRSVPGTRPKPQRDPAGGARRIRRTESPVCFDHPMGGLASERWYVKPPRRRDGMGLMERRQRRRTFGTMTEGSVKRNKRTPSHARKGLHGSSPGRRASILGLLLAMSCECQGERRGPGGTGSVRAAPSISSVSGATTPSPNSSPDAIEPAVLLTLPRPAYHTSITVDDATVYLLTDEAIYRVSPGHSPERRPLNLGYGAAFTNRAIVYWSKGVVWRVSKEGGEPERLLPLAHQPQFFVASGDEFAWVSRSSTDRFSIATLHGHTQRLIYSSPGRIETATMVDDWLVFVERLKAPTWRFGRIRTDGRDAAFTDFRPPRTPPALAAWRDEIYYYHGPDGGVRRLSLDLQRDEVLAKNFTCSPMAVADRVFCGQVPGLFEIRSKEEQPRHLTRNAGRMATTMAASSTHLAWVSDTGENQMAVMMLPLEGS